MFVRIKRDRPVLEYQKTEKFRCLLSDAWGQCGSFIGEKAEQ